MKNEVTGSFTMLHNTEFLKYKCYLVLLGQWNVWRYNELFVVFTVAKYFGLRIHLQVSFVYNVFTQLLILLHWFNGLLFNKTDQCEIQTPRRCVVMRNKYTELIGLSE
jgi:hypothetical protein